MIDMDNTLKYLKVTVYDNDFTYPLSKAVKILYDICYESSKYPDETDLEDVKCYINRLCFAIKQAYDHFEWGTKTSDELSSYLVPDVCIVDECDIPEWNNYEDIFMPLYDTDKELIIR